jgi:3D (Asp-Asp-Asp) domain-containing protein
VEDGISISSNPSLVEISGFGQLSSTGGLSVSDNDALLVIPDFPELTTLGQLRIQDNHALTEVAGFNAVTTLGGIAIKHNHALNLIDGFQNIVEVDGSVTINGYGEHPSISILPELTRVGHLELADISAMTDMDRLTTIDGDFEIVSVLMEELTGFPALAYVGGDIEFWGRPLASLSGLTALTEAGGDLAILNTDLPIIDIPSLTAIGGDLHIEDNLQLCDGDAESFAATLDIGGTVVIENNRIEVFCD